MKTVLVRLLVAGASLIAASSVQATGLAKCESGAKETWQPQEKLEKSLADKGWKVRRIKVDGGCYEVYGLNEKGEKVEAYFHPQTFAPVPTKPR